MRRFLPWKEKCVCIVKSTVTVWVHNWLLNMDFFLPTKQDFPAKGKVNVQSSSGFLI